MSTDNSPYSVTSSPVVSLAFHFRFIKGGEWTSSTTVALRLLARVIWSVTPDLAETGSLVVRMEKLFYTQELRSALEANWHTSTMNSLRWPPINPNDIDDLDRIFSIVVSGRLLKVAASLCQRLHRPCQYPFLFALLVNSENVSHAAIYLGRRCTPMGILHINSSFEMAFGSIEYHPQIEVLMRRMKIDAAASDAALSSALQRRPCNIP